MVSATELRSGKGYRDENFPVASRLIHPRHRGIILAFYNFVRTADDIADHASLSPREKLAHLDSLERSLLGSSDTNREGAVLRAKLRERKFSPQHAQDLLQAFRLDVTKLRYGNWEELIDYCRYSAMPVGRFVLDVHGESRAIWPANDALCAALQIINHLQDCAADYRNLDRVYLPLDRLAAAGLGVEALGEPHAGPALRACLRELATRTGVLLQDSRPFAGQVVDARLALEIAVIQNLAEELVEMLKRRDPLSERVHLGKASVVALGAAGIAKHVFSRLFRRMPKFRKASQQ